MPRSTPSGASPVGCKIIPLPPTDPEYVVKLSVAAFHLGLNSGRTTFFLLAAPKTARLVVGWFRLGKRKMPLRPSCRLGAPNLEHGIASGLLSRRAAASCEAAKHKCPRDFFLSSGHEREQPTLSCCFRCRRHLHGHRRVRARRADLSRQGTVDPAEFCRWRDRFHRLGGRINGHYTCAAHARDLALYPRLD